LSFQGPNRLPFDGTTTAEVLFLLILIWMMAGPISGAVLNTQTWLSGVVTKSANQVESTRNVANQLLEASGKIRTLEKTLADNELELTRLREQAKDTDNLRALLGLKATLDRKTIAADVITRNSDNWFEQITIDKGSLDHVARGSAVITSKGVVGQVTQVSSNASVVRLLTDPEQKLGILIPRCKQLGILAGKHKEPPSIDFVPVGAPVDVGDKVVCQGFGGVFPAGHPVGTVSAVRRDKNGTTLSIEVAPSENVYDLRQVLVVPPLM
jgi:rod shape-determining protein MreC